MSATILVVGLLLAFKHFVCDGPFQTPYQYKNKGNWRHPGGFLHAAIHGIGTGLILVLLAPAWTWLAIADGFAHYAIDYAKVNLTKPEWSMFVQGRGRPSGLLIMSDKYFYMLVADQSLHFACYAVILAAI